MLPGSAWKAPTICRSTSGPDVIARRIDDIDCAKEFLGRGLAWICLEVPLHSDRRTRTSGHEGRAGNQSVRRGHARITASAGLNPVAVELAGRSGCKIVWMPTVDAQNETAGRLDGGSHKLPFWAKIQRELAAEGIAPPPLSVDRCIGRTGRCAPDAASERIAKHNMILATGHLGRREIFALVRAAKEMGLKKVARHARRVPVAEA